MAPGQTLQATLPPQEGAPLPANQIQVQTALGPITLQTAMPIPKGAVLMLSLTSLTPQPTFLIAEVNGKPVAAAQTALKNDAVLTPPQTTKAHPPQPLTLGARVNATLVRPTINTSTLPQGQAQPQTNAQSAPQVSTVASQAQAPSQGASGGSAPQIVTTPSQATPTTPQVQQTTTAPSTSTPTTPTLGGSAASTTQNAASAPSHTAQGATAPSPAILPSGTRFTLSVLRIDAPNAALSTPNAITGGLAQGATLSGTITGTSAQGQPIVQTANATFAFNAQSSMSIGTTILFKLESAPQLPLISTNPHLGHTGPADTLVQARAWSDLDDGLKALAQVDPARFQQVAQNALPQPGAKLTSQMLFFLNALKGGDFTAWLGENATRLIDRARPGLVNRLSGDFSIMSKMADETQSGDWRLALVPLWGGEQVEQVRMYYRGKNEAEDDDEDDDGTRFILDFALSNLGHVQIDGLAKNESRKLDLIIRTEQPLPENWRTQIGDIFLAAQELAGLDGGVAFQASPENFIEFPPIDTKTPHPGLYA